VLSDMYERHAVGSERIDVDALMSALGAPRDGLDADDSKPLAWIRRGITEGATRDTVAHRIPRD